MGPLSVALVYNFLIIYQHFEIIPTTTSRNNTQPATVHLILQCYHIPSLPHVLQPVFSRRGASAPLPPAQRAARLGRAEVTFLGAAAAWARGAGTACVLTTFHAKICETFPVWTQNGLIPKIEKWKYVALCIYKNFGSYITYNIIRTI